MDILQCCPECPFGGVFKQLQYTLLLVTPLFPTQTALCYWLSQQAMVIFRSYLCWLKSETKCGAIFRNDLHILKFCEKWRRLLIATLNTCVHVVVVFLVSHIWSSVVGRRDLKSVLCWGSTAAMFRCVYVWLWCWLDILGLSWELAVTALCRTTNHHQRKLSIYNHLVKILVMWCSTDCTLSFVALAWPLPKTAALWHV